MWGQQWESMQWAAGAAVPTMGPIGLAFAIGLLVGASVVLHRGRWVKSAAACAVVALAVGPLASLAAQVSLPHSFMNGDVADADEVNANFAALRDAFNATAGRLGASFTPPFGPPPTAALCIGGKVVGEVWLFGGNFEPEGSIFANGQLLDIEDYPFLFSVMGTSYGGDGRSNFGVPDLLGLEPEGVRYVVCAVGPFPDRND
jgi:hypothetical protein